MKTKWARVRLEEWEERYWRFVGYNICESIKDAKRYVREIGKRSDNQLRAIIEETGECDK